MIKIILQVQHARWFLNSMLQQKKISKSMYDRYCKALPKTERPIQDSIDGELLCKHHAILTGKPHSERLFQIFTKGEDGVEVKVGPDVRIEHVQELEVMNTKEQFGFFIDRQAMQPHQVGVIANNEGYSRSAFEESISWPKPFKATIYSWNKAAWYGRRDGE